jgi:hypothetical protein
VVCLEEVVAGAATLGGLQRIEAGHARDRLPKTSRLLAVFSATLGVFALGRKAP